MNAGFRIKQVSAIEDAQGNWTLFVLTQVNYRQRVYSLVVSNFPTYADYLAAIRVNKPLNRPAARRAFPSAIL